MIPINFFIIFRSARLVSPLRRGLHDFWDAWRRCNSLEWNDHSASLRLALRPKNRTLHAVQLRFLGSSDERQQRQ
ncbi:MAG: hypothetical protein WC091_16640 [Sulfuricellaceae bacterium]